MPFCMQAASLQSGSQSHGDYLLEPETLGSAADTDAMGPECGAETGGLSVGF